MKSHFVLLANYNAWMNENIYTAARQLNPAAIAENMGAYFGSILGTLNHLLVADTIWLQRFAKHPTGFSSLANIRSTPKPSALDEVLYPHFEDLRLARCDMDQLIKAFANELSENDLLVPLSYTNTQGKSYTKSFSSLLGHFFNHQTHHRGQVSTLLTQAGVDLGTTDLLAKIPDEHH